ncbi:hypothetical protein [Hymenobacter jeollabukensis]|uniref:Transmembrane protein n=1 Tax=Hymenobacter jeollabukensis TaxID=2025313 RepID=A0A5R8WXJ4_9BACT|nr:hypothetical protein [Hymenobacter jeollabukensis]TLM97089.1 hypothetical protein FDY95_03600 [Hymenobacter jeollabukensis]
MAKRPTKRRPAPTPAPVPEIQPAALFRARLLGYLVGLLPLLALLLMFRQVLPSNVALAVVFIGFMASVWLQQRVRQRYPYDFSRRAEWWALGAYTVIVVAVTVAFLSLVR